MGTEKKPNITVTKSQEHPETVELLAQSIIQVSEAAQKLLNSGLTREGLIVLLFNGIGPSKINRKQIGLVLDNLPRLRAWYVKK